MINKTGIFLPQSELQSKAASLLVQSVPKTADEPEIIDFKAPSQLAAALRRADCGFAVIAAPEDIFLKTKIALIKYLGEKTVRSSAITAAIGEDAPLSNKEFDLHCAIPVGAKPAVTADGLFSGFTAEKEGITYVFLPLIEEKLGELLPLIFGTQVQKGISSGFRKNLDAVIKTGKKTAVASVGLSGALMAVVSSVEGGENAFSLSETNNSADSADSIATCAKEAKEASGADYGAAVSAVESENGESFMLVCLADSERARVAKVYAESGETPKALAGAAITKLCEMMQELAAAGALINPNPAPKPKKNPVLPIIITAIGIATAVILSLLVMFFIGEKDKTEAVTTTKSQIQAEGLAVYAAEAETTTSPAEEITDSRGGSAIGDEIELFASQPVTEVTTEAPTQTVTATPVSSKPTSVAQTTKPATTKAPQTTAKPTAAPTTRPATTVAPTMQKPATTKPVENKTVSGTFVFTSYGWGHGVGMSQEGAIAMAKSGSNYKQILANYYPGTTLKTDSSTPETVNYGGVDYPLVEYLCKASYREIGNSAPEEALKAQIVAIYTFAKTYGFVVDSSRHAFSPNWAYEDTATHKACLEVLGMASAEDTPAAIYVDYNGQPAFTCYFASSAGKTASANSVWGGNYAYLSGGAKSPEKVEVAELKISAEEMKNLILAYDSTIVLGDDPSQWIKILSHDKAYSANIGYASVVKVGNKEMRGNHFRSNVLNLQLRSHCFTVKYIPG